jgi:hypothetical protein
MKFTKLPQNLPNSFKLDQMAIKYNKVFQSKALQNLTKFGFWVWK